MVSHRMTMKTKIVRHGNSRAVVIPVAVADNLGWKVGKQLEVDQLANSLVLRQPQRRSILQAYERVVRSHDELFRRLSHR